MSQPHNIQYPIATAGLRSLFPIKTSHRSRPLPSWRDVWRNALKENPPGLQKQTAHAAVPPENALQTVPPILPTYNIIFFKRREIINGETFDKVPSPGRPLTFRGPNVPSGWTQPLTWPTNPILLLRALRLADYRTSTRPSHRFTIFKASRAKKTPTFHSPGYATVNFWC